MSRTPPPFSFADDPQPTAPEEKSPKDRSRSRTASKSTQHLSRPTLVDFLLLLAGFALSQYLIRLAPLNVETPANFGPFARDFLTFFAAPLRLCEGIVLLCPLFRLSQRLRGRSDPLTGGEWLWWFSWAGLVLTGSLAIWQSQGGMPDFLAPYAGKPRLLWYVVFVPAMAALALVLSFTSLLRKDPLPWTHTLSLALALWPVLPLAVILASGGSFS
jgi:hypothetical protein